MAAIVVTGSFNSPNAIFSGSSAVGGTETGIVVFPNTTVAPFQVTGATLAGDPAFSIPAGQFPVTVNPNQSVIIQVVFTTPDALLHTGTITMNTSSAYAPSGSLRGQSGPNLIDIFPSFMTFPNTKVGQTSSFLNFEVVNPLLTNDTLSALAFTTGTDFFIVGGPALPLLMTPGQVVVFTVAFIPTVVGTRTDTLTATSVNGPLSRIVNGFGTTLTSFNNLTGNTLGTLFAVPNFGAPAILESDQTNFNGEVTGFFNKISDWGVVNSEKELLRVRGHYEDLGPAVFTVTAVSRRINQPDQRLTVAVNIGTSFRDSWPREFIADLNVTGEITQLIFNRLANGGPVSIIDYCPEVVSKGEVIEGT